MLGQLQPGLSRQIREAAARAGLQGHDPAARLIAEMWVAVAALRGEREALERRIDRLDAALRLNRNLLLALLAVPILIWLAR